MLLLSSFLTCTGTGAFLKEGSLALGLGAEKKDESALASLTACGGAFVVIDIDPGSFFTTAVGFVDDVVPTAAFFNGCGNLLDAGSVSFRFFVLGSNIRIQQAN